MNGKSNCEVCERDYSTRRLPYALACDHSLCADCLNTALSSDKKCKSCQTEINASSFKDIPVNFKLLRIIRAVQLSSITDHSNFKALNLENANEVLQESGACAVSKKGTNDWEINRTFSPSDQSSNRGTRLKFQKDQERKKSPIQNLKDNSGIKGKETRYSKSCRPKKGSQASAHDEPSSQNGACSWSNKSPDETIFVRTVPDHSSESSSRKTKIYFDDDKYKSKDEAIKAAISVKGKLDKALIRTSVRSKTDNIGNRKLRAIKNKKIRREIKAKLDKKNKENEEIRQFLATLEEGDPDDDCELPSDIVESSFEEEEEEEPTDTSPEEEEPRDTSPELNVGTCFEHDWPFIGRCITCKVMLCQDCMVLEHFTNTECEVLSIYQTISKFILESNDQLDADINYIRNLKQKSQGAIYHMQKEIRNNLDQTAKLKRELAQLERSLPDHKAMKQNMLTNKDKLNEWISAVEFFKLANNELFSSTDLIKNMNDMAISRDSIKSLLMEEIKFLEEFCKRYPDFTLDAVGLRNLDNKENYREETNDNVDHIPEEVVLILNDDECQITSEFDPEESSFSTLGLSDSSLNIYPSPQQERKASNLSPSAHKFLVTTSKGSQKHMKSFMQYLDCSQDIMAQVSLPVTIEINFQKDEQSEFEFQNHSSQERFCISTYQTLNPAKATEREPTTLGNIESLEELQNSFSDHSQPQPSAPDISLLESDEARKIEEPKISMGNTSPHAQNTLALKSLDFPVHNPDAHKQGLDCSRETNIQRTKPVETVIQVEEIPSVPQRHSIETSIDVSYNREIKASSPEPICASVLPENPDITVGNTSIISPTKASKRAKAKANRARTKALAQIPESQSPDTNQNQPQPSALSLSLLKSDESNLVLTTGPDSPSHQIVSTVSEPAEMHASSTDIVPVSTLSKNQNAANVNIEALSPIKASKISTPKATVKSKDTSKTTEGALAPAKIDALEGCKTSDDIQTNFYPSSLASTPIPPEASVQIPIGALSPDPVPAPAPLPAPTFSQDTPVLNAMLIKAIHYCCIGESVDKTKGVLKNVMDSEANDKGRVIYKGRFSKESKIKARDNEDHQAQNTETGNGQSLGQEQKPSENDDPTDYQLVLREARKAAQITTSPSWNTDRTSPIPLISSKQIIFKPPPTTILNKAFGQHSVIALDESMDSTHHTLTESVLPIPQALSVVSEQTSAENLTQHEDFLQTNELQVSNETSVHTINLDKTFNNPIYDQVFNSTNCIAYAQAEKITRTSAIDGSLAPVVANVLLSASATASALAIASAQAAASHLEVTSAPVNQGARPRTPQISISVPSLIPDSPSQLSRRRQRRPKRMSQRQKKRQEHLRKDDLALD